MTLVLSKDAGVKGVNEISMLNTNMFKSTTNLAPYQYYLKFFIFCFIFIFLCSHLNMWIDLFK